MRYIHDQVLISLSIYLFASDSNILFYQNWIYFLHLTYFFLPRETEPREMHISETASAHVLFPSTLSSQILCLTPPHWYTPHCSHLDIPAAVCTGRYLPGSIVLKGQLKVRHGWVIDCTIQEQTWLFFHAQVSVEPTKPKVVHVKFRWMNDYIP